MSSQRPWSPRGPYVIVDPDHCRTTPISLAAQVLAARPAALQLRWKNADDQSYAELAKALLKLCREANVPFVVNDRVSVAAELAVDGVHIGQEDMSVAEARAIVRQMWLGVSTHDLAQAERAVTEGVDLIGFGPVFRTATKANPDPVVGLEALADVTRAVSVPVVAIGGVNVERAQACANAGASMVAAISLFADAEDPAQAVRELAAAFSS